MTDASDTEFTASSGTGNSGLTETIRPYKWAPEAKVLLHPVEQPICRHGVAALLEYQRWSNARRSRARPAAPRLKADRAAKSALRG